MNAIFLVKTHLQYPFTMIKPRIGREVGSNAPLKFFDHIGERFIIRKLQLLKNLIRLRR